MSVVIEKEIEGDAYHPLPQTMHLIRLRRQARADQTIRSLEKPLKKIFNPKKEGGKR